MDVNSLVDHCLALSFDDLKDFAWQNYKKVETYIQKMSKKVEPYKLLVPSIYVCIAADGELADEEFEFIKQLLGKSSYIDALDKTAEFFGDQPQKNTKKLYDIFPLEIQEAYLRVCVAVLTVDRSFDQTEVDYLKKLLGI